jgi:predicted nucleic acid-binding Zn ribbon protein
VRRTAPRPLALALASFRREAAPKTTLARAQQAWRSVSGPVVAGEAEPIAERDGVLTIACRSAVWANELELLSLDLVERLNDAIGAGEKGGPLRELRVTARGAGSTG